MEAELHILKVETLDECNKTPFHKFGHVCCQHNIIHNININQCTTCEYSAATKCIQRACDDVHTKCHCGLYVVTSQFVTN